VDIIVVGCGWAGERHVLAAQALERRGANVHLAALVDSDAEHLAAQAVSWGVAATFTSLPAALAALPDAQGVILATPHTAHREGTCQAAAAGRHVLVEKPMALTLKDADAMIEACESAGVTLMVAESKRYQRQSLEIGKALAAGRIGQVLSGRLNAIHRGRHAYEYPGRRAWLALPEQGGSGMWMLNGIHTMSAVRMFFGEVERIHAREVHSRKFQGDCEATVVALAECAGGALVSVTISVELHGYGRFSDVALFGADGTLYASQERPNRLEIYSEIGGEEAVEWEDDESAAAPGHFIRQLEEFVAAVGERREPSTGGRSERATLAAVLAGYESMWTGRPVVPTRNLFA
jgi:UDP-N-acetyl-2-amino-2-deoxyglucuronate dehydrogenase